MKKIDIDKNLLADKMAQWLIKNTSGDQQYLAVDIRQALDDGDIASILAGTYEDDHAYD